MLGCFYLVAKGVDNCDVRVHFHRMPVEDGGAIAPLAYSGQSRLNEKGVAGNAFQRFDPAFR